jgi:hypothetical protein
MPPERYILFEKRIHTGTRGGGKRERRERKKRGKEDRGKEGERRKTTRSKLRTEGLPENPFKETDFLVCENLIPLTDIYTYI